MIDIFNRIRNIIVFPRQTWEIIRDEKISMFHLFKNYVFLLVLIPVVSKIIGRSLIGIYIDGGVFRMPIIDAVFAGVVSYIVSIVGIAVSGFLIYFLSAYLTANADLDLAMKIVVYSAIPLWIAGIFLIYPNFSVLFIIGLYAIHVFFQGLPILFNIPPDRGLIFVVTSLMAVIFIGFASLLLGGQFFYLPDIQGQIIF